MRTDRLKINRSVGLRQIKDDLRNVLKTERTLGGKLLQDAADTLYDRAIALVPIGDPFNYSTSNGPGTLRDSIDVKVSKSLRYPGILAIATARNPKTGYDYALIQHENEAYEHPRQGQAHYLAEPFEEVVDEFLEEMGF